MTLQKRFGSPQPESRVAPYTENGGKPLTLGPGFKAAVNGLIMFVNFLLTDWEADFFLGVIVTV
jgi:hypothetical protein